MIIISSRNVNDALIDGISKIQTEGKEMDSRNGSVLSFPYPVCTVYNRPIERVMIYKERDANPFFHFQESMWMLAGRNDVEFVSTYSKQLKEYSTDGITMNGAYGYRWRNWFDCDQLKTAIHRLKTYPNDRRTVVQMWDGYTDLVRHNYEKDHPCNTAIYFIIVDGALDMTVTNRSNDMLWGAYGANAVHFSFLQEYIASAVGVPIGKYYQFSNNLHVYTEFGPYQKVKDLTEVRCPYATEGLLPRPMVNNSRTFLSEVEDFLMDGNGPYTNTFLNEVAIPIREIHKTYKTGDIVKAIFETKSSLQSADWGISIIEWLERRLSQKGNKMRVGGKKYTGDFQVDSQYERDPIRERLFGPTKYTKEMTDQEAYRDAQRKYEQEYTYPANKKIGSRFD